MKKMSKRKVLKAVSMAVTAFLLIIVVFLLGWLRERKLADYKQFFADNQSELTLYADAFLGQNNIMAVSRSRDIDGMGYRLRTKKDDMSYISFTVPYYEEAFWANADFSKIHGNAGSSHLILNSFLAANGITEEEFLRWRAFLAKYDFLSISQANKKDSQMTEIEKTSWSGFEYRKETDVPFGYGTCYMSVLNDYWIYFDEDGIDHFSG